MEYIPNILNPDNVPFYVVNDEAYDRMYKSLSTGEARYIKTFLTTCPATCKHPCTCPYYVNFFKDGKIVRIVKGEVKDVMSLKMVKKMLQKIE